MGYGKEIKEAVKPVAVSRSTVRKRISTSLPGVDEETVLASDYGKKIIKARIKLDKILIISDKANRITGNGTRR